MASTLLAKVFILFYLLFSRTFILQQRKVEKERVKLLLVAVESTYLKLEIDYSYCLDFAHPVLQRCCGRVETWRYLAISKQFAKANQFAPFQGFQPQAVDQT
uniref:Uncharacterized protein n=1 Tax=Rhodnius prolixus TaxID=13249 RepID=T1HEA1_RHOPR